MSGLFFFMKGDYFLLSDVVEGVVVVVVVEAVVLLLQHALAPVFSPEQDFALPSAALALAVASPLLLQHAFSALQAFFFFLPFLSSVLVIANAGAFVTAAIEVEETPANMPVRARQTNNFFMICFL